MPGSHINRILLKSAINVLRNNSNTLRVNPINPLSLSSSNLSFPSDSSESFNSPLSRIFTDSGSGIGGEPPSSNNTIIRNSNNSNSKNNQSFIQPSLKLEDIITALAGKKEMSDEEKESINKTLENIKKLPEKTLQIIESFLLNLESDIYKAIEDIPNIDNKKELELESASPNIIDNIILLLKSTNLSLDKISKTLDFSNKLEEADLKKIANSIKKVNTNKILFGLSILKGIADEIDFPEQEAQANSEQSIDLNSIKIKDPGLRKRFSDLFEIYYAKQISDIASILFNRPVYQANSIEKLDEFLDQAIPSKADIKEIIEKKYKEFEQRKNSSDLLSSKELESKKAASLLSSDLGYEMADDLSSITRKLSDFQSKNTDRELREEIVGEITIELNKKLVETCHNFVSAYAAILKKSALQSKKDLESKDGVKNSSSYKAVDVEIDLDLSNNLMHQSKELVKHLKDPQNYEDLLDASKVVEYLGNGKKLKGDLASSIVCNCGEFIGRTGVVVTKEISQSLQNIANSQIIEQGKRR